MNDDPADDLALREHAWASSSLDVMRALPYPKLRNYLYSACGEQDCHRVVTLGLTEIDHHRIREAHRVILGALANATPKDTLVDDQHPEEEDSRVLALAVVLAAQAVGWEPRSGLW